MTLANTAPDAPSSAADGERFGVHWSVEQTLTFIKNCYDRDALLDTLLGFSQRCLSNRMVLLLGKNQAKPYRLQGWPELDPRFRDRQTLVGVKIDLAEDAPFFEDTPASEEQLSYAEAKRPEDIGIGQLFVELTLFPPERVVFQTVRIGAFPAIALFGEPLKDASADKREQLQTCAQAVGAQLTEILRLTRSYALPPAEQRIPAAPLVDPAPPAEQAAQPALEAQEEAPDIFEEDDLIIPGLAVESSVSEEVFKAPPNPGATAYGLPFADKPGQPKSAAAATSFGLPFIDAKIPDELDPPRFSAPESVVEETSEPGADASPVVGREVSEVSELSEASEVSEVSELSDSIFEPQDDISREANPFAERPPSALLSPPKSSTMEGGFTVDHFAPPADDADDQDTPAEPEVAPAKDAKPTRGSGAPKAQILRHISLKHGRKTGAQRASLGAASSSQPLFAEESSFGLERSVSSEPSLAQEPSFAPEPSLADEPSFAPEPSLASSELAPSEDAFADFPGAVKVDRYQYTVPTLPPVEAHGPMLAELASMGAQGAEIARKFLTNTSIEVRFYATYLFSKLPAEQAVEPLLERLFDRDQQTRESARNIILAHYHHTRRRGENWLDTQLRPFLHATLASEGEELRTEVAAGLLGAVRDAQSVDILIESLDRFQGRTQESIQRALQTITYLDLGPYAIEWNSWRGSNPRGLKTNAQERGEWIVDALNAPSLEIREMVYEEISRFQRLDLNYHPEQPEKLRIRAQEDMQHWLTLYPPE